jgi:hypothetical protein
MAEDEWSEHAKRILRTEMVRRGVTYEDLSQRLSTLGVHDSPVNLRNKVSRGKFSAAFMLAVCDALGAQVLRLAEIKEEITRVRET